MNTNKIKQLLRNSYVKYSLVLIIGILLGWLIFSGGGNHAQQADDHSTHTHSMTTDEDGKQIWTCSMHPQIKMDKPGKCPICGMDLIPLKTAGSGDMSLDPNAIQMSKEAVALANIQTTIVSKQNPVKEIRLYGTVQADERLSQSQTSHVSGRIEKLFINFTGENVKQGQTIATIYSPDLLNAQQELIEASKMQSLQPALLQAAREKLRLWKLSDSQILQIEQSQTVSPYVDVKATTSGIVVAKKVNQGDYINQGSVLFDIANLSRVWVMFDAYESDIPFLKVGDKLNYTLQAIPGKTFTGSISFINPILDPVTRTVKVRVETPNPGIELKPEMYTNAVIKAPLKRYDNQIVIPRSAILWTGKRSIVYIKEVNTDTPTFMLREVELGPSLGESYVILSGIDDGDEIVTNGTFTIDASAQLEGKLSMMNEADNKMSSGQSSHNHKMEDMANHTSSNTTFKEAEIRVQGKCEMCKDRIEKAAKAVVGVKLAVWNLQSKQLKLSFDTTKTSEDVISKAIAKVGHDTDKYKADNSTYNALPSCCKYRN